MQYTETKHSKQPPWIISHTIEDQSSTKAKTLGYHGEFGNKRAGDKRDLTAGCSQWDPQNNSATSNHTLVNLS